MAVLGMVSPLWAVSSGQAAMAKASVSLSAPSSAQTRLAFTLSGSGRPAQAGRPVVVQRLSGRSWAQVGRTTQSSTGHYSVRTSAVSAGKFTYRAVALSWHGAAAVTSPSKVVSAHAPYILLTPGTAIRAETVKAAGKLPGVGSRPVWVQRKSGIRWVTLIKARTTRTGSYATSFKAPALGSYPVRTLAPRVTIAGKVRAQYVTAAKTHRVVAQSASLSIPTTRLPATTAAATLAFRPVRAGRAVALQVVKSGVWTAVSTGKQSSTGTASFTLTADTPGSYSYRAWTAAADDAPWFASPTRILVITPPVTVKPLTSATTVASSSTATSYDTALTLTASVAGATGTPTGEVKFTDASNGSVLAVEPISGGVARLTTAALAPGTRNMVVTYSGDNVFSPSASTPLVITVAPPQRTIASAFQNSSRHDGMDTGDTFNPATLHQAWSINLNPTSGSGTASVSYPLIAGGRVFVTVGPAVGTSQGSGNNIYAFDAVTGSVDWHAPISSTYGVLGLTYDGGQVFVQSYDGEVTAYAAASGHANWTTNLRSANSYGFRAPPTAYDGVLYVSGAGGFGTLLAVSEANGEVVWSSSLRNAGTQSSPAVDDSGVYGGATAGCNKVSVFGLDGTNRWTNGFLGCSDGSGTTTVLNDGHLYLHGEYYGEHIPGRIVSTDTGIGDGTFAGRRMPAFDATNMYVVRDGVGGHVLDALDKSGSPTRWTFIGDGAITTSPVTTNGIVFTGSNGGNLYGIDSTTGAQVWTAVAPGPVFTDDGTGMSCGLAAADGLLAVPAAGFLTVYTS